MRFSFLCFCLCLFVAPAFASSPGMIEGPEGCTWNAKALNISKKTVKIQLDEVYGTCVDAPCTSGEEGDVFTVSSGAEKINKTDIVKVWVDTDASGKARASLKKPDCWTKPVTPSTP